jgi:hypothetical protein
MDMEIPFSDAHPLRPASLRVWLDIMQRLLGMGRATDGGAPAKFIREGS